MPLRRKNKMCFYAFPQTVEFPVSPSNLKKFDGVSGSREGSQALRVLFWYFFRTSEKSTYRVPPPWEPGRCAHPLRTFLAPFSCERKKCGRQSAARRKLQRRFAVGEKERKGLDTCLVSQAKEFIWIFQRYFLRKKF